jgi:hypothetical protein
MKERGSSLEADHIVGGLTAFQNVSTKSAETAPLMPPFRKIAPHTDQDDSLELKQCTDFNRKIW